MKSDLLASETLVPEYEVESNILGVKVVVIGYYEKDIARKVMSSEKNWLVWKERLKGVEKVQKSKTQEGWKNFTLLDLEIVKDKREMFWVPETH